MIPIQAILIVLILGLGTFFIRRARSRLAGRAVLLTFILTLSVFVLFPDLTTWIANVFGIGRGTDFLFYTFALFVLYALSMIYLRLREQDRKMTIIVRTLALQSVIKPDMQEVFESKETEK